jgi:hypothetical protein
MLPPKKSLVTSFSLANKVFLRNTLISILETEIGTGLWVGRLRNRGSIPDRDRRSLLQIAQTEPVSHTTSIEWGIAGSAPGVKTTET